MVREPFVSLGVATACKLVDDGGPLELEVAANLRLPPTQAAAVRGTSK
jgi:hypothetical protein